MPRNITVTFDDGSKHVYQNAPDDLTPEQVTQRAQKDFGKQVKALDGGRKTAPQKSSERPSLLQSMGRAAKNVAADIGIGMAAIPDLMAEGGRLVDRGITMGVATVADPVLRGLGANKAADVVKRAGEEAQRGTGIYKRRSLADMFEATAASPPEQRSTRMAAQFLGGMMSPIPGVTMKPPVKPRPQLPVIKPVVKNAGREIVEEGEKAGVRVLTSDVKPPQTFIGKRIQAGAERIPLAGTGGVRVAQQKERVEAVKNIVKEYGGDDVASVFDDAPSAIDDVAKNLTATREKALSGLTAQKNAVIDRFTSAVPIPKATQYIDDTVARLKAINEEKLAPVIAELESWKRTLPGKTLREIEENRKILGAAFDSPDLAHVRDIGKKAISDLYGPLREDMGAFIRSQGGKEAFNQWRSANDELAGMAGELGNTALRNVLKNAEMTPEGVARLLFSRNKSDVERLMRNLSPFGKSRAQAALLQRAFERSISADSGLSVERFVGNVKALSDSIGVAFKGSDRTRIEGLTKLLDATRRASQAGVMPPTGVQVAPTASIAAALHFLGTQATLVAGGAAGLLARAYESAPVRNALLKLGQTAPGSAAERVALKRTVELITRGVLPRMERVGLNDNAIAQAAAGQGQEQQQGQQAPLEPQPGY